MHDPTACHCAICVVPSAAVSCGVIAAVAIGGAEINGGSASILGTFLGVVLLGCISSALTFLHISPYWEKAIQGVIILVAVSSDAVQLLRPRSAGAH